VLSEDVECTLRKRNNNDDILVLDPDEEDSVIKHVINRMRGDRREREERSLPPAHPSDSKVCEVSFSNNYASRVSLTVHAKCCDGMFGMVPVPRFFSAVTEAE